MNLAADVLTTLDVPRTMGDIRERVVPSIGDLDGAIASLVAGCYIVLERGVYRKTTRNERERWNTEAA